MRFLPMLKPYCLLSLSLIKTMQVCSDLVDYNAIYTVLFLLDLAPSAQLKVFFYCNFTHIDSQKTSLKSL